ncbi:MAG: 5'-methylthioadenosine/adenosylhomocysteine nucleosidase [Enterobacteriaceae bacterium]
MNIGILIALKNESYFILNIIKNKNIIKIEKIKVITGNFLNLKIFVLISGIGKVFSSIGVSILHYKFNIKYLINIGTAGGLNKFVKVNDIIIPNKFCYHDVNMTDFNFKFGFFPGVNKKFTLNKVFLNFYKKISKIKKNKIYSGLIVSGDSFVNNSREIKKIKKKFKSAVAVDMESSSIFQSCKFYSIPCIFIKSISDIAGKNSKKEFKKNVKKTMFNQNYILLKLLNFIFKKNF